MCQNRAKGGGNGRGFAWLGLTRYSMLPFLSLLFLNHSLTSDYVFLQLSMDFLCELKSGIIHQSKHLLLQLTRPIQKFSSEEIYVLLSLFLCYHKTVLEIINSILFFQFYLQNCKMWKLSEKPCVVYVKT